MKPIERGFQRVDVWFSVWVVGFYCKTFLSSFSQVRIWKRVAPVWRLAQAQWSLLIPTLSQRRKLSDSAKNKLWIPWIILGSFYFRQKLVSPTVKKLSCIMYFSDSNISDSALYDFLYRNKRWNFSLRFYVLISVKSFEISLSEKCTIKKIQTYFFEISVLCSYVLMSVS